MKLSRASFYLKTRKNFKLTLVLIPVLVLKITLWTKGLASKFRRLQRCNHIQIEDRLKKDLIFIIMCIVYRNGMAKKTLDLPLGGPAGLRLLAI